MPSTLQVINRYIQQEYVNGAAVTFDNDPITAKTPRTAKYGYVTIPTDTLKDGAHVLNIIPDPTTAAPVGPIVAEEHADHITRCYRALRINVNVKKGSFTSYAVMPQDADNGTVVGSTAALTVRLQPIYFRSPNQTPHYRKPEGIKSIILHQTATAVNMAGTLHQMMNIKPGERGASHYILSADPTPQVVKVVQDTGYAWHLGGHGSWAGDKAVVTNSIGIEMSHKAGTPWPAKQISMLCRFLETLLKAHPSIKRNQVVGHHEAYTTADYVLVGRDCPGFDFDWTILEKEGIGLIPRGGSVALDTVYGGYYVSDPAGWLRSGDEDQSRRWGGQNWPVKTANHPMSATAQMIASTPVRELQNDLRDIGYSIDVNGKYDFKTRMAVEMFQPRFFAGPRRGLIKDGERGTFGRATAEYVKRVRP